MKILDIQRNINTAAIKSYYFESFAVQNIRTVIKFLGITVYSFTQTHGVNSQDGNTWVT